MPTGFTANLYDGKDESFEDFVLSCARGMGAFVTQRDDPHSDKPAFRKVSDYYFKQVAEAEADLAAWRIKDEDDKYDMWRNYADARQKVARESRENRQAILERYEARLMEVEAWEVPALLQSFKDFMIEQINSSIEFDCGDFDNYYKVTPYEEWLDNQDKSLARDVDYYEEQLNNEVARVREQNTYTFALYKSLGLEP